MQMNCNIINNSNNNSKKDRKNKDYDNKINKNKYLL